MTLTASVPATVTVEPSSLMIESPIACAPVNLAMRLVVPPAVVTPPPVPAQLPLLRQTVPLSSGRVIVRSAVRLAMARVSSFASAVAPSKMSGVPPCRIALTVRASAFESPKMVLPLAFSVPLSVSPAKVGVAVTSIFWIVLITPPLALKLVALNWAIPLPDVDASLMVMVLPTPLALLIDTVPLSPLMVCTPGQACHDGAPAPETKHNPGLPVATEVMALVPLPIRTPLAASVFAPVPPELTANGVLSVVVPVTVRFPPTPAFAVTLSAFVEVVPETLTLVVTPMAFANRLAPVLMLPVTPSVPVKLAADEMVWPLMVPLSVTLPVGPTANSLVPLSCRSSKLPVAPTFVLLTVSIAAVACDDVSIS